jgi:hypothetical protein
MDLRETLTTAITIRTFLLKSSIVSFTSRCRNRGQFDEEKRQEVYNKLRALNKA